MPVYNGAAVMDRAIESLLSQTFDDFELVISDNASTDDSAEIAATYAKRDSRVRLVSSPVNRGASWNFDHVFREAAAEYFAWAAADDSWDPRYFEACVAELDARPEAVACISQIQPVTSSGHPVGQAYSGMSINGKAARDRWRAALRNNLLHSATYALMRRQAVARTRMVPAYVGSDHVFVAELALLGEIFEIPEVLSYKLVPDAGEEYRSHQDLLRYLGGTGRAPWLLWMRVTKELALAPLHVRPDGAALPLLVLDPLIVYFVTDAWRNDAKQTALRVRTIASRRR